MPEFIALDSYKTFWPINIALNQNFKQIGYAYFDLYKYISRVNKIKLIHCFNKVHIYKWDLMF